MKTLVTIFTYLTLAASLLISSSDAYSACNPSPHGTTNDLYADNEAPVPLAHACAGSAAELGNRTETRRGKELKLVTEYKYAGHGSPCVAGAGRAGATNASHQLISVKDNKGLTRFEYAGQDARVPWAHGCAGTADALGRRVTKQHIAQDGTATQTDFLWQGDVLLEERTHSAGGKEQSKQTYLFKPNSFEPLALIKNDEVYRFHLDHLGTPEAVSNAQGQTIWAASFKSYGNLALKQVDSGEITQPIRFQGQYFDEETGLHYNRHRYYDPGCGQFITQDPIGLLGGSNNYQYVPNPVSWVDPLGLSSKECPPKNTWNAFQTDHAAQFGNSTEAAAAYADLKKNQSPWPYNFDPPEAELLPGTQFNMALSPRQPSDRPGGFGTFDSIENKSHVYNELAVKKDWKPELDRVVTYEVTRPLPVKVGPVGPQLDEGIGKYLSLG